jgi:hypothetical protein
MKNRNIQKLESALLSMRSIKYSLFALAVIFIMFNSCKKDDQISTTALKIRNIDEQGNPIPGVTISLYKSLDDMENQKNQIGSTLTSDANGEVTFDGLESIKYYWFAQKGCKNNVNGITTTDTLEPDKIKIVTSTLLETGTLELINQSTSQFQIFIDGSLLLTADAQYSYNYIFVPAGSYSIRVLQVGGSINKTYTGTVTCGNKLSITFP